jgi:hypothetical protein
MDEWYNSELTQLRKLRDRVDEKTFRELFYELRRAFRIINSDCTSFELTAAYGCWIRRIERIEMNLQHEKTETIGEQKISCQPVNK